VNNFGTSHFTNVYYRSVANNFAVNRVSYNGGAGGLNARPTHGELAAEHDRHIEGTSLQRQHEMGAHNDRSQFASVNHGRPDVAATVKPGEFNRSGVVHSTRAGGAVNPGVYAATNSGHTNGYTSFHNSNPGGGGNHQSVTAHSNAPSYHSQSPQHAGTGASAYHSTSPLHNESSHGSASSHQTELHGGPSQQHSSKPSGVAKNERPETASHH
jgi:hypothetical protein